MLIPIFNVVTKLGLINTRFGVILVLSGLYISFGIYLIRSYYSNISREKKFKTRIEYDIEDQLIFDDGVQSDRIVKITIESFKRSRWLEVRSNKIMKVSELIKPKKSIIKEIVERKTGEKEIKVRIKACGVCTSEYSIWAGKGENIK
jgi:hypothetical protein